MTYQEYRERNLWKWNRVRPVVMHFGGERFLIEYDEPHNVLLSPFAAMAHAYLGNASLMYNDH